MSIANVKKFHEDMAQDQTLKQKFVKLSQKYQGQPLDEANTMAALEQEALALAAQLGYSFTMDDVKACGEEWSQLNGHGALSDEELQAVTGAADDPYQVRCFVGGWFLWYRNHPH